MKILKAPEPSRPRTMEQGSSFLLKKQQHQTDSHDYTVRCLVWMQINRNAVKTIQLLLSQRPEGLANTCNISGAGKDTKSYLKKFLRTDPYQQEASDSIHIITLLLRETVYNLLRAFLRKWRVCQWEETCKRMSSLNETKYETMNKAGRT